jgi:hypothetical protein
MTMLSTPVCAQSGVEKIRADYQAVSEKLQKHLVDERWLDDDPESPGLLARQWSLAGEWVAAWLDAHPSSGADGVKTAIAGLMPSETPRYLVLNDAAFLVAAPSSIGNVFIVAKTGDRYRLAWSTAQRQVASGKTAEILAAWRPENARQGRRGPYWTASGKAGPVIPHLGSLPTDAKGRARFYIDGWYQQGAGGTVGAQISLWVWDGIIARAQITRDYTLMVAQTDGTRIEGDLLKVQQKKSFRTFFSCGQCEERQTDWIVRVTPEGMKELGERSVVPELDAVDEFFDRLIHGKSAADVATPAAIQAATKIVREARAERSDEEWKKFPTLGMIGRSTITKEAGEEILCLETDDTGAHVFTLKPIRNGYFIGEVKEGPESCSK